MSVGRYSRHHSGIEQELDRFLMLHDKIQYLKLKPIVLLFLGFFFSVALSEISSFVPD